MKKIVNPCTAPGWTRTGRKVECQAYASIEYEDGELSICGVVGPMNSGDCAGSAGQCVDSLREGKPNEDWTAEMLDKFCNIWDRWHLNTLRPYCQHQRELGWDNEAREPLYVHNFTLNTDLSSKKREIENQSMAALRRGETIRLHGDELRIAALPLGTKIISRNEEEDAPEGYKPDTILGRSVEKKTRGWVRYGEESDLGLIGKPCPVCGYKYGHAWQREEVPQEVIDWLFALPDTKRQPAWV